MTKENNIKTYLCEFCSKEHKTKKGAEAHEKRCTKNPKGNILKNKITAQIENIRCTARSPQHLISLLQEFWLSLGIKVTFKDYPTHFSLSVSNSHNAPKMYPTNWGGSATDKGVPTGYPGWKGRWEGTVEITKDAIPKVKRRKNALSFSDLKGDWSDSLMNVWYIQTGTGSGGQRFSYDGMLWLYDFPLMHEEFEKKGGNIHITANKYNDLVKSYYTSYSKQQQAFIDNDTQMVQCVKLHCKLVEMETLIQANQTKLRDFLITKFNDQFAVPFPKIHTAFDVDQTLVKQGFLASRPKTTQVHPELVKLFETIEQLIKDANDYIEAFPEYLL